MEDKDKESVTSKKDIGDFYVLGEEIGRYLLKHLVV
jgi:hypothetical protein